MTSANLFSRTWTLAPAEENTVAQLAAQTGLSRTVARVLVARGIDSAEAVRSFLDPVLERDWESPGSIAGMDGAADAVAQAVREAKRIVVFGDFDLDGISAAAVATRGLRAFGADVEAVVPHRFNEGYGLSAPAIERVMRLEPDLVVTVDCGISSGPEVEALLKRGVAVVVTDHHEPGAGLPVGVPVADPKLAEGAVSELAGAGVALKLVGAVGERLGEPDAWRQLTDLATLGTIADIVPLVGENRALVTDGVRRIRTEPRAGIAALCAVAGLASDTMTAESVAYGLAPRLNSAGRMADPAIALELLLTDDPTRAEGLAVALDEHNRVRQSVEADLFAAASAQAERLFGEGDRVLVLGGEGWHEGVKGIVASRLAGAYGVPTFLFSIEDGEARGSGRSVGQVDLFHALQQASDLLDRFGGHRAAVGLGLPACDLDRFRDRMKSILGRLPAEEFARTTVIDADVTIDQASVELGTELAQLQPFGEANRPPLLAVRGVFMNGRQKVGRNSDHFKFEAFDGASSAPAISFRCRDIESLIGCDEAVDLAFNLDVDVWRGRTRAQMLVRDIVVREAEPAGPAAKLVEDLFAHADEILAREEYAGIGDAPSFHTKLAGVTFEGRQEVLGRLGPGTPLRIERQPDNPHDGNAIALYDPHGDQVGFFNRRLAASLAPVLDAGAPYDVEVTDVTGGDEERALGVNVLVSRRSAVLDAEDAEAARAERRAELSSLPASELDSELVRRFIGERPLHAAQIEALGHLAAGDSTLAVMATGRGKSLIFHLHAAREALKHGHASIFVFPLRALVADQAYHLSDVFSQVGLEIRVVTGESSLPERDVAFSDLAAGVLDVVLTTPEFLDLYAEKFAATAKVRFLVVDEAHHIGLSRAGHRPAYSRLAEPLAKLGNPTVLAVTATAGDEVSAAILSALGISAVVLDPTVRENLLIEDKRDSADKDTYLARLVATGGKTIVYVNSRDKSVQIARSLRKRVPELAFRTAFYNGGLGRAARNAVERAFRDGDLSVVIATSAFGEGVNVSDVRNVVLYHLPFNDVEFNQMCGRAGRDGAASRIHLLFGGSDARINDMILSSQAPVRDDMAALYLTLKDMQAQSGPNFEVTNAELAEKARRRRREFALDERGVSSALGVLRELGFVESDGHGPYRRLTMVASADKVELESSVRYAEGLEEIAEFGEFKSWVLTSEAQELLSRINRPILPSTTHMETSR